MLICRAPFNDEVTSCFRTGLKDVNLKKIHILKDMNLKKA